MIPLIIYHPSVTQLSERQYPWKGLPEDSRGLCSKLMRYAGQLRHCHTASAPCRPSLVSVQAGYLSNSTCTK
jgi:hypothetical protein